MRRPDGPNSSSKNTSVLFSDSDIDQNRVRTDFRLTKLMLSDNRSWAKSNVGILHVFYTRYCVEFCKIFELVLRCDHEQRKQKHVAVSLEK